MYRASGGDPAAAANQYGLPDEQNPSNFNSSMGVSQPPFSKRSGGVGGIGGPRRDNETDYRGGERRGERYDRPPRRGPPPNRSNRHDPYDDDYVEPKYSGKLNKITLLFYFYFYFNFE